MKYSIIIPCYNVVGRIDRLFGMMEECSKMDCEVVFVDDCSPDDSYEQMMKMNPYPLCYKILKTEKNMGPGGARNKGVSCSTGEYILFCDSDDWFDVNVLNYIDDLLKRNKNCDTVVFPYRSCGKKTKEVDPFGSYSNEDEIPAKSAVLDSGVVWSKLFSRSIIEENNIFFPDIKNGEDRVFWTKYCCYAKRILKCNYAYYNYVKLSNSITRTRARKNSYIEKSSFEHLEDIYKEFFPEAQVEMFVNGHLFHYVKLMCSYSYSAKSIRNWLVLQNKRYPMWIKHMNMKSQSIYRKCIYCAMYYNKPGFIKLIMFVRRIIY